MRRWWWMPVVAGAVGLTITLALLRAEHDRDERAAKLALERTTVKLAFVIEERIHLPAEALHTVAAFVAHAPSIDRTTFDAVAAAVARRTPRIYAIEWAPLIPDAERAALEAHARTQGYPTWEIREPSGDDMVPASRRAQYLPILYSYPDNPAGGFDVLSRGEAAEVFQQACSTGQAVFSPRYKLVEDREDLASLILYVPVWRGGRAPEDRSRRCEEVAGVAILIFRVTDMLAEAISSADLGDYNVALLDVTGIPALLYENTPGAAEQISRGERRRQAIDMFGRSWQLRVGTLADPGYSPTVAAVGGGASLVGAVLVGLIAWVMTNRRRLKSLKRLGQYHVEGEIGRGSMGVVYRAHHVLLGRPAALKLLPAGLVDAASRAQFEREVRLAAKLQHPSIVAVYDFGVTTEGLFFYAMELLDGVTVRDLVEAQGALPPARAAALVKQIAEALREAHDKQIAHRDLAPANLMITMRGATCDIVKILDFGLVRRLRPIAGERDADDAPTDSGHIVGTPGFIAPEVLRGRPADERVDIYALGCVWYGLLSGRFPFVGATADGAIRAQLQGTPVPLRKLVPELPVPLVDLVADCMQADPRLRLRSMREVLQRLAALDLPVWSADDARRAWKDRAPR